LFESASGGWSLTHTFSSITGSQYVPFDSINSYGYVKNSYDRFGNDIQINGNTIVIGAPYDASYYEYSGSNTQYSRGAAYIYNRKDCPVNTANANGIYADDGQVYWDLKSISVINTLSNQIVWDVLLTYVTIELLLGVFRQATHWLSNQQYQALSVSHMMTLTSYMDSIFCLKKLVPQLFQLHTITKRKL
jgi:hypothetical protein